MQPQQWLSNGKIFDYQNHQLFYVDSNPSCRHKPVLLLIHGFPTSSYDWQKVWTQLTEHYRCIAMDMLGFGYSDKPKQHNYSIHQQADLHEALLQHLNINKVHLLAHDYGDSVAQELLARANNGGTTGYISVCLLNGGLFPETHQARLVQKLLLSPIGSLINKLIRYQQFCRSFSAIFGPETKPSDRELRDLWQILQYKNGNRLLYKLITYMYDRRKHRQRWIDALNLYPGPLLLINGSLDPVSGKHMVDRFRQLIDRAADIIELGKIGHYPHWEAPDHVVSAYLNFVEAEKKEHLMLS
ncbi:alpha/beta hydrolase [Microbulbifer variabilis]|uniref:Alpha/beta hydrolase n=1 Tax=Microbulbifer variabilis TaxID=266805 RepID=A0ABY4VNL5_9GAMM|nr:alpha/beta hydrolase [Microbulbifer variabilis]USD23454.1 alpha/beta hydrolase [Microbulbifer variabilis]